MCIAICYKEDMENALSKALSELLRRTKGATQIKVGKHAGISQPYVSDLKNGDRDGGIELWEKISEYFGMAYDDFYNFGKKIIEIESETNSIQVPIPQIKFTGTPPEIITGSPPQRRKTDIETQTDKNHQELVGRFKDKELALQLNQMLITIEQRAPEKMAVVEAYLKGVVDSLPEEDTLLGNGTEGK